jgi:hypothetical protein
LSLLPLGLMVGWRWAGLFLLGRGGGRGVPLARAWPLLIGQLLRLARGFGSGDSRTVLAPLVVVAPPRR